jgi:hypothetical protein
MLAGGNLLRARSSPLLDTGGLPREVTQEVQLGSSNLAVSQDLDLIDARRREEKGSLYANVVGDPSNLKGPLEAIGAMQAEDDPLEHLNTLLTALDHLYVNLDGISNLDLGTFRSATIEQFMQLCHRCTRFLDQHGEVAPGGHLTVPCVLCILDEQGSQNQGNRAQQLHEHVQRWSSRVLVRVAHGIAHDARLMSE